MRMERVLFRWLDSRDIEGLSLPAYATEYSAGMDIRAAVAAPLCIEAGQHRLVGTNLAVAIPPGYELQVRPRSGLAAKYGLTVLNTPGTIDADYRGEIQIILINHGAQAYSVNRGERIAQLVLAPVARAVVEEAESLTETARGNGGFGHTGI